MRSVIAMSYDPVGLLAVALVGFLHLMISPRRWISVTGIYLGESGSF